MLCPELVGQSIVVVLRSEESAGDDKRLDAVFLAFSGHQQPLYNRRFPAIVGRETPV